MKILPPAVLAVGLRLREGESARSAGDKSRLEGKDNKASVDARAGQEIFSLVLDA